MPALRLRKGSRTVLKLKRAIVFAVFVLTAVAGSVSSASAQQRLALVIGQSAYDGRQLATAANDAGLIAQTLTSAGFEVVQGRDLNANDLRGAVRDFLDKAQELGSDGAVMVYLSGYGLQLEGENYLLPVDARIQRDADIPIDGFRLSDLVRSLERIPAQTRIVVADMARDYTLPAGSDPIARGLALMEPPAGFLIAFSSAPNITTGDAPGPYGHYATALAETIRQPGVPVNEMFNRVRLRTHETTQGLQTPWHMANLDTTSFMFFEPEESASLPLPVREVRRIEEVPAEEAYNIAVERDTIPDYQAFLRRYPDHALARRVSALLAARREAIVWRRTVTRNTSEAYWTYLRRYPNGPHAADCRRRLARLSAPIAPPPVFEEVVYEDLPPPLPVVETVEVVEVVTIIREAPPPPPPPVYFRSYYEEDVEFVTIIREPPPPPILMGVLPIPSPIPVPRRARPPRSFYQPIAPMTPRGPVAIPVAAPPIAGPLMGRPDAPRPPRGRRPEPVVPRQPGLTAPPQPIPVAARPRPTARELSGIPSRPSRLPSRPILVPTAARPEVDRPVPSAPRPTAPVPRIPGRPSPAVEDRSDRALRPSLPEAPRPNRPLPIPSARDVPDAGSRVSRPDREQDRPSAARQLRRDLERERPAASRPDVERERPVVPRPSRPQVDDDRPDRPRPARPALRDVERARPPRPAVERGPERRIEAPRPVEAARPRVPQVRPAPERPTPQPREIRPSRPVVQPRPAPQARPVVQPRPAPEVRSRPAEPAFRPSPARGPSAREEVRRPSAPSPNRRLCPPGRSCPQD
jgi:uncharacterized caspase-like protein